MTFGNLTASFLMSA